MCVPHPIKAHKCLSGRTEYESKYCVSHVTVGSFVDFEKGQH